MQSVSLGYKGVSGPQAKGTSDMTMLGLDVSKATLAAALWQPEQAVGLEPVTNSPAGWDALRGQVAARLSAEQMGSLVVVLEPTGGYELGVALWAYEQGWQVALPNPRQVRDWARSQGRRAKTDRQDALVLAQYGAQQRWFPWQPLPEEVAALEELLRRRADLEGLLQRERNRQEHLVPRRGLPRAVPTSVERLIKALEEELAQIEQAIHDHLQQYPPLQQARTRLLSVPGLGQKNVLLVLVLLARWQSRTAGQGTSKGLVAYTGLDPQPNESGTSVQRQAGTSRMGEREVRRLLYMGALGASRGHNPLPTFYERLVGRGKAKKLALVAAARKLLTWAWAVYQAGTPFDATKFAA
jgi:transposase